MSQREQELKELQARWNTIQEVGGPKTYIEQELRKKGVLRTYRPDLTSLRSDREKKQAIEAFRLEDSARKKLRKFVWEAYTAVHLTHLGLDIFWNDVLGEDFFDPFERTRRLEDSDLPQLESLNALLVALKSVVPEMDIPTLRWYCYHRDVATTLHYKQFSIPKKSGGLRHIWAPKDNLKAMQRWILENVVERMPIHGAAHGFVPGRSIVSNAELHTDSKLVVNVDLKDFFPTFTFRRVKGVFRAAGYMEGIATVLALICTEAPRKVVKNGDDTLYVATGKRCLPQGSPASPMLTNVACLRLDRRLSGYADSAGWRYSRYADDLTFSCPADSENTPNEKALLDFLRMVVEEEGLTIHPTKTTIRKQGQRQEVTGLIVNGEGAPRVPKKVRRMLRSALHNAKTGVEVEEGYDITQLMGYGAFVHATDMDAGKVWIEAFQGLK